MELLYNKNTPM